MGDGGVSTKRGLGVRPEVSRGVDHEIPDTKYCGERARDLIQQTCEAREVVIMRGATSPDHIHILLSAPAQLAPSKLVQFTKGRSSRKLMEKFPELRKKYWGQHMWARGYFCAMVGAVDEATITRISKTKSGMKTIRDSRSQRPPSLEPALSREHQAASAATRLSIGTGFCRL
jgi:putative transposase